MISDYTKVLMAYHDGEVSCRLIKTLTGTFWLQGQIARDAKSGKFVSLRYVFA